jgi:hypothetical protein
MIVAQVIHTIESMLTMNYYTDPAYFTVWSKIMMPTTGSPPTEFYYYSLTFSFIAGLLFTVVYTIFEKSVPGNTFVKKGLMYGLLMWLVGGLSGSLAMVLLINLPIDLIAYWTVSGLIVDLIAGIAITKIVS